MTSFFVDPTAPVQPDQFAPEFFELLTRFEAMRPRRVLEVGVREGGSLYQWIKRMQPGGIVVALDLPGVLWGTPYYVDSNAWQGWAQAAGVELHTIIGDSHDPENINAVAKFAPFDFVFIDGDHSDAGARMDFLAYSRLVRPGGIYAMHDVLPDASDPRIEVYKLWREIRGFTYFRTEELTSGPLQTSRGIGVMYV